MSKLYQHSRKPIRSLVRKVSKPVLVEPKTMYRQIGVRSHGRGLFDKELVTGKSLGNKRVFWVEPDCFIVNIVFAWEQAVGRTTNEDLGKIASHRFPMYRTLEGEADLNYLVYFFNTQFGKHLLGLASPGGAGRNKTLGQTSFLDLEIPIPPVEEQRRIAEILGTWDRAIETTEKLIAASEAQKKALMQQLLTGQKRLPGFEGEWRQFKLSKLEELGLIELGRGKVISRKDIAAQPGPYPIYSSSVKNNGVFGHYGEYLFDEELISWSVDGGGHFFYRPKHRFSVTNVSGWMKVDASLIDCSFLANQLQRLHSQLQFDYQTKAHPSVIRELYTVYLPSLDEQVAVSSTLLAADSVVANLDEKLQTLKTEKAALMQQLLTGKRRVNTKEMAA